MVLQQLCEQELQAWMTVERQAAIMRDLKSLAGECSLNAKTVRPAGGVMCVACMCMAGDTQGCSTGVSVHSLVGCLLTHLQPA